MTARFFFRWYDLWIGAYYDRAARALYICPVPMVGVCIARRRNVRGPFYSREPARLSAANAPPSEKHTKEKRRNGRRWYRHAVFPGRTLKRNERIKSMTEKTMAAPREAKVFIEESAEITLDVETAAVLREHAFDKLADALNDIEDEGPWREGGAETQESAKLLIDAAERVKAYAEVLFWLAPASEFDEEEPA